MPQRQPPSYFDHNHQLFFKPHIPDGQFIASVTCGSYIIGAPPGGNWRAMFYPAGDIHQHPVYSDQGFPTRAECEQWCQRHYEEHKLDAYRD